MNKIKLIILSLITLIFIGCGSLTQTVNPVSIHQSLMNDKMNIFNDKKNMKEIEKKKNIKPFFIKIKPNKDTFLSVIEKYNNTNPYQKIILKDNIKKDFILKYPYTFKDIYSFINYINVTLNKKINITRFNENIYKLSQINTIPSMFQETYLVNTKVLNFVDLPLELNGQISYYNILNIIQKDYHIPVILNSDSNDNNTTNNLKEKLSKKIINNYQGTIKKIIQRIAIDEKLFINYKDGMIILSDKATRLFELKIPSIDYETKDIFKNMTSVELKPYDDLKSQLQAILSKNSTLNINQSTGQILIKGNYEELRQAQILLKNFYNIYNKSIAMDVYIYQVNLNKENKFGVSFDINEMSKILGSNTGVSGGLKLALGTINQNVNAKQLAITKNYVVPAGQDAKFNKFFLNFLNQFGNTEILTKPKLETINTIPVSMSITTSQDYISSIDQTTSTDTNANTSNTSNSTNVQKNTIKTGFTLGLYPMAERNGKIKIIVKPKISQLLNLTPYNYGSDTDKKTIQLVTTTEKDFSQIINIKNNEVAIISGYIYDTNEAKKDTLPYMDSTKDSILDPITSAKEKNIKKIEMIIAIKARIIE